MQDIFDGVAPMVHASRISVPYHWWAGETASRFFISLRDDQTILGTQCSACGKTYVPPRKTCPTCFTPHTQWKAVASQGSLVTFTVVRRPLAALPQKPPILYGLIRLDGADTALLHIIGGVRPEDVQIGMRLQARFARERRGTIFDIECFCPVP